MNKIIDQIFSPGLQILINFTEYPFLARLRRLKMEYTRYNFEDGKASLNAFLSAVESSVIIILG